MMLDLARRAAGFNTNVCTWLVASGPSQLELVVIDWLCRWIGYPDGAGGLLTSGGSAASLDAIVAAREAAGHPERATVYMSDQSHSAHIRSGWTPTSGSSSRTRREVSW